MLIKKINKSPENVVFNLSESLQKKWKITTPMIPHYVRFVLFLLREPLVAEMVYYALKMVTDGVML